MEATTKNKIKTIRLNDGLIYTIEKMAKEQNRNFNNMVETILKEAVNKAGVTA